MSDDNVKIAESFGWKYLPSSQDGELEPNYRWLSPEGKFVGSLPKNLCRYCGKPHDGAFVIPSCIDTRIADLQSRLTAAETRVKELERIAGRLSKSFATHDQDCSVMDGWKDAQCSCGLDSLRAELDKLKGKS